MTKGAIFSLFCPALSSVPNHYLSVIARGSGLTLAPSLSIEAKPGGRGTDIAMFKQQISTNRNLKSTNYNYNHYHSNSRRHPIYYINSLLSDRLLTIPPKLIQVTNYITLRNLTRQRVRQNIR